MTYALEMPNPMADPRSVETLDNTPVPFRAGALVDDATFARLRRSMVLEGCKWDPQVGDVTTLARYPLLMSPKVWSKLAGWAEQLTAETLKAEREILSRPRLLDRLGLPRAIRRLLRQASELPPTPAAVRVMRFDFHFTTEGWKISEVNSDVPGGFTEASTFTQMMAKCFSGARMAGNPIQEWSRSIGSAAGERGVVALLSAPGFMEDHQIVAYLAGHLQKLGCRTCLAGPQQIEWRNGQANLVSALYTGPIDCIVRFYQGEWLAHLPRRCGWTHFFLGGATRVGNPGIAILSESKRFPLVWDELQSQMPTWRRLLPETRDPRDADWTGDEGWLLKSAFCNNGDTVSIRARLGPKKWKAVVRSVRWNPGRWLAQRRFEAIPVETSLGAMHPCIGVYTFDGKAAGAYARITPQAFIDYAAVDVPLLLVDAQGGNDVG